MVSVIIFLASGVIGWEGCSCCSLFLVYWSLNTYCVQRVPWCVSRRLVGPVSPMVWLGVIVSSRSTHIISSLVLKLIRELFLLDTRYSNEVGYISVDWVEIIIHDHMVEVKWQYDARCVAMKGKFCRILAVYRISHVLSTQWLVWVRVRHGCGWVWYLGYLLGHNWWYLILTHKYATILVI